MCRKYLFPEQLCLHKKLFPHLQMPLELPATGSPVDPEHASCQAHDLNSYLQHEISYSKIVQSCACR